MGADGSILVSVMMVVAVTGAIVYDMVVNQRGRSARRSPARHVVETPPVACAPAAPLRVEPVADGALLAKFGTARAFAGSIGDDDLIRELSERLAALRLLGFDYVRTAHPLFRARETDAGADGVATATALPLSAPVSVPTPPRRRRARHVRPRGTAALRLVVDRRAPLAPLPLS